MPKLFATLFLLSLVACVEPVPVPTAQELAVTCTEGDLGTYEILPTPVLYADAAAACAAVEHDGVPGVLVTFESTAELQAVFDAWVEAQYVAQTIPPSEAVWTGAHITNVEGGEWVYAMMRGGVLNLAEPEGDHLALPACEWAR